MVAAYSKRRVSIGVADRHVVAAPVVLLIDGEDPLRGKTVDRSDDRRVDQPREAERQEVEAVVDEVELGGALEYGGDVQALPHLRVDGGVFRVSAWGAPDQASFGDRVSGGEEGDVEPALDQALGQERDELLPWSIVAGRHAPRDRGEHRHAERGRGAE